MTNVGSSFTPHSRRHFLQAAGAIGTGLALGVGFGPRVRAGSSGQLVAQVFPGALDRTNELLADFVSTSGATGTAITIPSDYYTVTQTRLLGGDPPFDCFDIDPGFTTTFDNNGWIVSLDGLPGAQALRDDMYPSALAQCLSADGRLMSLPVGNNLLCLFVNTALLDEHSLAVAADWDELLEQAVFLKGAGVAVPFATQWASEFNLVKVAFITECISRGMASQFDAELNPLWDSNPVALDVLNYWRQLQDAGVVPVDAVTLDNDQSTAVFKGGDSAYMLFNSYTLQELNDPTASPIAGQVRLAPVPGESGATLVGAALTLQSTRSDPEEAWQLTNFVSGAADGDYTPLIERTAIRVGAPLGYRTASKDPRIAEAWAAWASADDLGVIDQSMENAQTEGPIVNEAWYADYSTGFTTALSAYLSGQVDAEEMLAQTADEARQLRDA